jgi:hypothetical protein
MKFSVIVADPPYGAFKDNLQMSDVKRSAKANYNTMLTEEIKVLKVSQ